MKNKYLLDIFNPSKYLYVQYNSDGSQTKMNPYEYAEVMLKRNWDFHKSLEHKYSFDNKNIVSIPTKDLGIVKVSLQMIDAFLKYGKMAGVSKEVALGLPFQESSFGLAKFRGAGYEYTYNQNPLAHTWSYNPNNSKFSPVVMFSNWNYYESDPYKEYVNATDSITDDKLNSERKAKQRDNVEKYEIGV